MLLEEWLKHIHLGHSHGYLSVGLMRVKAIASSWVVGLCFDVICCRCLAHSHYSDDVYYILHHSVSYF